MTEVMHLYSAEQLTPGDKELELDERIEPVVVTWDAALKMVDSGEIVDAKTLVGLWVVERRRRRTPA
jgi:ADP-ribose pyrophosphatase